MSWVGITKFVHLLAWVVLISSSIQKNRLISSASFVHLSVLRLRFWDKVSGATSGLMILSGVGMLLWGPKPTSYYLGSHWFFTKIIFLVVGSAWIVYTRSWMRRVLTDAQWPQSAPAGVRHGLRFDLICLSVMSVCGLALAHGWSL